jgi:formate--tetrahydrofolate ligase
MNMIESPDPERIERIAAKLDLPMEEVEPCGWFKAKLALGLEERLASRPRGKYIGVTAINPTPLGEGKTATAIGLSMALSRLGHRAVATLRQPSQAPVFGIKGGGAGGGRATLLPFEDINLHFTGDLHAIAAANNLLAALIDNHLKRGKKPVIDPASITWRRAIDVSDKSLAQIVTGPGDAGHPLERRTGFDLTAASEVMAIVALANSVADLHQRLARIVVGQTAQGDPITANDIGAAGSMAALLRDAIRPNLVQTAEHTPALVHAGPFGNIAHGNSSVLADMMGVHLADYVVTESGFGADCGAEKLFHIKCLASGLTPDAEVLVCTVRGLKFQSGRFDVRPGRPLPADLLGENLEALQAGAVNLKAHLDMLRLFGIPVIVAINRFPTDSDRELDLLRQIAKDQGAEAVAVSEVFARGSEGGVELARGVIETCKTPAKFRPLYTLEMTAEEKIETLAKQIYGADGVDYLPEAKQQLARYRELGFGKLPICIAKTQYSLSHDPKLLGRPKGFRFPIRSVRLAAGAGFLYALAGEISTMPGLPAEPRAYRIGLDNDGTITGLT